MKAVTMTAEQAAERLRAIGMKITPTTIRDGMAQGRFPFGDYIKTEKSCVCYVYPRLLDRWIADRFDENYQKPEIASAKDDYIENAPKSE